MIIHSPIILEDGDDVVYEVRIEFQGEVYTLWYRLCNRYTDFVTQLLDPAVVALIIPAMAARENITLSGSISERLLYYLSGPYQSVLMSIIPSLDRIEIIPDDIVRPMEKAPGVLTGFSGGIDSFCVLADHYFAANVLKGFRITHLSFNNVGSHGKGAQALFRKRYERLVPAAERIGLPFISIDSNLDMFYRMFDNLNFQMTHTPRNASVALLLQGGVGRYLYASAFSFEHVHLRQANAMGYSDLVTLPMLSTDATDVFSVGSQYSRVEKTMHVAAIPDSYDSLDICVNDKGGGNCSVCSKCMRTLLTLEIGEVLDKYNGVFDIDAYFGKRCEYIQSVLKSNDPLLIEIVNFAEDRRVQLAEYSKPWRDFPQVCRRLVTRIDNIVSRFRNV